MRGIKHLGSLGGSKDLGFQDIEFLSQDVAFSRLERICDFSMSLQTQAKAVNKAKKMSKFTYDPTSPQP